MLPPLERLSLDELPAYFSVRGGEPGERSRIVAQAVHRSAIPQSVRDEIIDLFVQLCDPQVSSMNIAPDPMTRKIYAVFINTDFNVLKRTEISPAAVSALFSFLAARHRLNVPLNAVATAVSSVGAMAFVRWTVDRQIPYYSSQDSQEGEIRIYARKLFLGETSVFKSPEDLAKAGAMHPDWPGLILRHLESSTHVGLLVTGPPFSGKTTVLNAILQRIYQGPIGQQTFVFYGDAVDVSYPPGSTFRRPTDVVSDITLLSRCNAMNLIIGEVASEAAAKVMVLSLIHI